MEKFLNTQVCCLVGFSFISFSPELKRLALIGPVHPCKTHFFGQRRAWLVDDM
jgi:hypothetical protein